MDQQISINHPISPHGYDEQQTEEPGPSSRLRRFYRESKKSFKNLSLFYLEYSDFEDDTSNYSDADIEFDIDIHAQEK